MARPWVKWKFEDWRGDPRLRMCSLAARGLWADLLAYMHEGEPYGHFTIDGKVPELQDVARLVGAPAKDVRQAYAELERHGVFSRTAEGVPYSRRLVRDREMADVGRTFAEKRWSPTGLPNGGAIRGATQNPNTKTSDSRPKTEEPKASPLAEPADLWKRVWESGRAYLTANGQSEGDARQALMRWRQNHHETDILRALKTAQSNAVELPIPYINTLLSGKGKPNGSSGQSGAIARIAGKVQAAREDEARRSNLHES